MKRALVTITSILVAACGTGPAMLPPDPPVRALFAIPPMAARAEGFADERQIFETVLSIYRAHGLAADVRLDLSELVLVPYAKGGVVHCWHFLGDGPSVRAHIDAVSTRFYGGRLADWQQRLGSDAAAGESLGAFMTAVIGHEVAHATGHLRGAHYSNDPFSEESRAIRFEWAVLRELIARRLVPADSFEKAVAFHRMLLTGAPPDLVATLPRDEAARRERFNAGYRYLAQGDPTGHEAEVDAVLALYTIVRLEVAAEAPEPWSALAARMEPPTRPPEAAMRNAALAFLKDARFQWDAPDLTALGAGVATSSGRVTVALSPTEATATVTPQIALGFSLPLATPIARARRAAAAVLLGRANREHDAQVCDLAEDFAAVRCRSVVGGANARRDLSVATGRALTFFARWMPALTQVIAGRADADRVAPLDLPEAP